MGLSEIALTELSSQEKRRLLAQLLRKKAQRLSKFPLSFAQQRLWFLQHMEQKSIAYNVSIAVQIRGPLQVQALVDSLREVVHRHESLRTTFVLQQEQPIQVIDPDPCVELPVIDLQAIPADQRVLLAQNMLNMAVCRPFDLSRGPLLRTTLIRVNKDKHALLFILHHIIADAWSLNILIYELTTLYEAFVQGQPSPLAPLSLQYADFAVWQRNWLQGEVLQNHIEYWRKYLRGATALQLPTDRPRPTVHNSLGARASFVLEAELAQALTALSLREEATLFMTLLSAFQILLYRYTGQTDLVVGTDIANRTYTELEALIGFFVNLLPLRMSVGGTLSFQQYLRQVREMVLQAYTYQHLPFEMLVEHLRLERHVSQTPLIQVLFVLQNVPRKAKKLSDVVFEPLPSTVTTAKFDLALFMRSGAEHTGGEIVYNTELFDQTTITQFINRFTTLLQSIVAAPDSVIDTLEFYTAAEKEAQMQAKQERRQSRMRGLKMVRGKEINL